jgi:putative Holliday junction resolvase
MVRVAIGLDVGTRRIGVARGDDDVRIAVPLGAITADGAAFTQIQHLVKENQAAVVVVGLPRNAAGQETQQSQFSRDFATKLADILDVEVILQDESLTSVQAEKNLRSRRDFDEIMLRDGTLDSEAAALFLTDYLDNVEKIKYAVA